MDAKTITVTPSQTGRSFDGTAAVAAAVAALSRTDAPDELVVEADSVTIQPAHGLLDTLAAKYAAERMARGIVVTHGNEQVGHQGGRRPELDPLRDAVRTARPGRWWTRPRSPRPSTEVAKAVKVAAVSA